MTATSQPRSVFARLRETLPRTGADWGRAGASALAWAIILTTIGIVVGPTLVDLHSLGTHDWDQMEAHRYLVTKSIRRYGQFPFWNPYACGGHPSWAGVESGTSVVSPWLPFYLWSPLPLAIKVEVVGTALLSAIGTWLFAGRFTRSAGLRAFACAVFVVNGRWALQAAAGHTWHLYYAWTPWVLFFFDRAVGIGAIGARAGRANATHTRRSWRDVVLCGACIAMMVYNGGIYPLPETIVALGIWALVLAIVHRSLAPLGLAIASGLVSFGLAAPKLLPVLEVVRRFPRAIESTETLDLRSFIVIFTSRDQTFSSRPAPVSPYGWHEWGIYIGWVAFLALGIAVIFARGKREVPLKWAGMILVVLGFGAFHEYAPWTLFHEYLPIFKSQHVPSRWLYPATLVLAVVFASMVERGLGRLGRVRALAEIACLAAVAWISIDVALVARLPMAQMFGSHMPKNPERTDTFHTEQHVTGEYSYDGTSYGPASLPAEIANVDEIDCMIFPGLSVFARDAKGVIHGMGAKGKGDPAYKGEVFTGSGKGTAKMVTFTPNRMTVQVEDATPGDRVFLNQNWDPGWLADGVPVADVNDLVSSPIHTASETIVFRYRPRTWWAGIGVFVVTVGALVAAFLRRRARTPDPSRPLLRWR